MYKTIGILAHVDAGKTTLSEQILYKCNVVRKLGRVDHGDALLDSDVMERRRGITVFSDVASFDIGDDKYFLIDTPGHMDFQAECERVLPVLDYAILVVSAVEMVQAHTENLFYLLREYKIPAFVFINKVNREGADASKTFADIKEKLVGDTTFIETSGITLGKSNNDVDNIQNMHNSLNIEQADFTEVVLDEQTIETISDFDEDIMQDYLEGNIDMAKCVNSLIELIRQQKIMLVSSGSALNDVNIDRFLKIFAVMTRTTYDENTSFGGRIFRVCREKDGTRLAYIKCTSGKLKTKDIVEYVCTEETEKGRESNNNENLRLDRETQNYMSEKVNEIRLINGPKFQLIPQITAGMVCAVTGLSLVKSGQGIGNCKDIVHYKTPPVISAKVIYSGSKPITEIFRMLKEIEDQEPELVVKYLESIKQIQVAVCGKVQLEVIVDIMQDRYNTTISFSKGDIIYRESICASTGGYGHYEPLRHYAEVHLRLEPTPNGSGISFRSECPLDILSKNWQNLIRTHIFEKQHIGALVGAELTDIEFVLTTGRDHLKHTEGGDFREATYRAIRQAARTSKHAGTTMLLEPFYNYDIQADASLINRIISDIQKMCGTYDNTEIVGDYCFIRGVIPVSTSQNYYDEFMALSKGRGRLKLKYGGYMECHNTEEVVKDMAYDADRDIENTANSIFCSHGAGYEVKWQDAKHMMHIQED